MWIHLCMWWPVVAQINQGLSSAAVILNYLLIFLLRGTKRYGSEPRHCWCGPFSNGSFLSGLMIHAGQALPYPQRRWPSETMLFTAPLITVYTPRCSLTAADDKCGVAQAANDEHYNLGIERGNLGYGWKHPAGFLALIEYWLGSECLTE